MRVITRRPLRRFAERWPDAAGALADWYRKTTAARWRNFADLKRTFGQSDLAPVDSGNTVVVFDVGGNKYRLVAAVNYNKGKVYVLRVLTHKEYDAEKWKRDL
ncbi:MAG: type II toxin-antitoxin system HigB family toxin [Tepidisphaeraceae bacterium]